MKGLGNMLKPNIFINGDCFESMKKMKDNVIDIVMTSPFYNTSRKSNSKRSLNHHEGRYDVHLDNLTDEEYIDFSTNLFNDYDRVLKKNGVILYNLSYSSENTHLIWLTIADIIKNTNFTTADTIIWKKKSALPNNTSHNRLTRITEYIFVFCRKDELKTFNANKEVKSTNAKGQKYYENYFNFVEAKNNDGKNDLNKATYSSELCEKLLSLYAKDDSLVYDSFMGTGTTAVACRRLGHRFIGSEISYDQCVYSAERMDKELGEKCEIVKL